MVINPTVLTIVISVLSSIITALIIFAAGYGKLKQEVKSQGDDIKRIEDIITATKYDIKEMSRNMDEMSKNISRMQGTLETFIKLQCMKDEMK
jgi:hypothetical protein